MDQAVFIIPNEPNPGHGRWNAAFPQFGDFKIKIGGFHVRFLFDLSDF